MGCTTAILGVTHFAVDLAEEHDGIQHRTAGLPDAGGDRVQGQRAVGVGRKRTIQILEFFDRVGYTRRILDARILRTDSAWHQE